jgi:uncharacterized protein YjbI with pentapeptide repeats
MTKDIVGKTTGENEMYRIKFLDGTEKEFNTLVAANLQEADLRGADLREANLRWAYLHWAYLR